MEKYKVIALYDYYDVAFHGFYTTPDNNRAKEKNQNNYSIIFYINKF